MSTQSTKRFSVSIPEKLFEEMEMQRAKLHNTRSEFIRTLWHAWQVHSKPAVTIGKADADAIVKAREEFSRGEYVTLEELDHELDSRSHT